MLDKRSAHSFPASSASREILHETMSRSAGTAHRELAVINLDESIAAAREKIGSILGEKVGLDFARSDRPALVVADPELIACLLAAIATYARHAMPRGGELRMETTALEVSQFAALCFDLPAAAAEYVCLSVSDNGNPSSRSAAANAALLEIERLSAHAAGVVRSHAVPGLGTTVRILFHPASMPAETQHAFESEYRGHGTVLVVDDDSGVRQFVCAVLRAHGFNTLDASSARAAVRILHDYAGAIELLVTDFALDDTTGTEVCDEFQRVRPEVPVIGMSGFLFPQVEFSAGRLRFLAKPFTARQLMECVERTFATPRVRRAGG